MIGDAVIYRGIISLAVGLGIALGTLGFYLVDQFSLTRRRRLAVEHEVHRLATDVDDLRYQVQQLRVIGCKKSKPATQSIRSTSSEIRSTSSEVETSDVELVSALDTAEDDEEFYDISDNESETGDSELMQLLREVDRLLSGSSEEQQRALDLLEQYDDQYSEETEVLWRFAKVSHTLAASLGDSATTERKKTIIQKGCDYAERAMKLNPFSSEAHKWYAINVGTRGQLSGFSDKISDGVLFKKHVDEAVKLKPNDGDLHYLLGRFNFDVASLPWMERSAASLLGVPSGSFEDALKHFLKAERLMSTPSKENRVFIARCHEALGDVQATVEWLEKADIVESVSAGDEEVEKILPDLLTKYASHCRSRRKQK